MAKPLLQYLRSLRELRYCNGYMLKKICICEVLIRLRTLAVVRDVGATPFERDHFQKSADTATNGIRPIRIRDTFNPQIRYAPFKIM